MLYGIGRVDASGRVAGRDIVHAVGWKPGDRLELQLTTHAIVIYASASGLLTMPPTQRLVIPVTARRHCAIDPGDHVLLAAAPEHGVVIVHPLSALDDMLVLYHSPSLSTYDHDQP